MIFRTHFFDAEKSWFFLLDNVEFSSMLFVIDIRSISFQ